MINCISTFLRTTCLDPFSFAQTPCSCVCYPYTTCLDPSSFAQAPCPDSYRGVYRSSEHSPGKLSLLYAETVQVLLTKAKARGRAIAAYIAESLQSCGGQIVYPPGYLQAVYRFVYPLRYLQAVCRIAYPLRYGSIEVSVPAALAAPLSMLPLLK